MKKEKVTWNPCFKEVTRLAVNELLPFEQIQPSERLASILDNKVKTELVKIIKEIRVKYHCGKCDNSKVAEHALFCKCLTDLEKKTNLTQ